MTAPGQKLTFTVALEHVRAVERGGGGTVLREPRWKESAGLPPGHAFGTKSKAMLIRRASCSSAMVLWRKYEGNRYMQPSRG